MRDPLDRFFVHKDYRGEKHPRLTVLALQLGVFVALPFAIIMIGHALR